MLRFKANQPAGALSKALCFASGFVSIRIPSVLQDASSRALENLTVGRLIAAGVGLLSDPEFPRRPHSAVLCTAEASRLLVSTGGLGAALKPTAGSRGGTADGANAPAASL